MLRLKGHKTQGTEIPAEWWEIRSFSVRWLEAVETDHGPMILPANQSMPAGKKGVVKAVRFIDVDYAGYTRPPTDELFTACPPRSFTLSPELAAPVLEVLDGLNKKPVDVYDLIDTITVANDEFFKKATKE